MKFDFKIIGGVLLILIMMLSLFMFKKDNQEEELNQLLKQLGSEFYEEFYYDKVGNNLEERKKFLEKYKDIGIKINLENLSRYNSEQNKDSLAKFVNKKTNQECDKTNTMVIIYPTEPYEKNSYTEEIKLICGFEK
mgnify:CR=1 FL=1